jgi:hypothetical protein
MRWYASALIATLALTGCIGSEAPLFEEDKASVTVEPRLVGTWNAYLESRPTESRQISIAQGDEKSYVITQEGQEKLVEVHIVGVMGHRYLTMRELPPETDATGATEDAPTPEVDPNYYYLLLKEIVHDDETGAVALTLRASQDPQFVASFIGRHPEFNVETQRIEPEGDKIGKLILQGETEGLRSAMAALGDTVDGFGAELKLHLVPMKGEVTATE